MTDETNRVSNIYLVAETFAGGSVEATIKELAALATKMNVWVKCDVNGIEVLTPPDAGSEAMWSNYQKASQRKAKFVSLNVIPNGAA